MADPIRPSDQSGSSPISPQIKVPPLSAIGGQVPPNLPIKEEGALPPKPAESKFSPLDIKLTPPSSSPASPTPFPAGAPAPKVAMPPPSGPKPEVTPPTGGPGGPSVFKSSIRTMQEDILAVKKGQPPVGFRIEKESEKDIKPPLEALGPKVTLPPKPTPEIKLGELEKARPLPGIRPPAMPPAHPGPVIPPAPPLPKATPGLAIPTAGGTNWKKLALLIGGLVVVAFLVWFFVLRGPSEVAVSPTPTYTVIPTPTPVSVEGIFGFIGTIKLPNSGDPFAALKTAVASQSVALGEAKVFHVVDESDNAYDFDKFLGRLLISIPNTPESAVLKTSEWALGIYGQQKGLSLTEVDKKPFVFIDMGAATNADQAQTLMDAWRPSIVAAFAPLFGYNKNTQNQLALDTYNTVGFSYVKIPDKTLGLAYTIIGKYLLFASSKDSFRAVVDTLVGSIGTGL